MARSPPLLLVALALVVISGMVDAQTNCTCGVNGCHAPCLDPTHPMFGVVTEYFNQRGGVANVGLDLNFTDPLVAPMPIEQVFVSPSGRDGTAFWIVFQTQDVLLPSWVWLSTDGVSYDLSFRGSAKQYRYMDYISGYIHKVNCTGLQPATLYYYRIGKNPAFYGNFTTPPANNPNANVKLAMMADVGVTWDSVATLQKFSQTGANAVVLVGDFCYADTFQPRWDTFGRLFSRFASNTPFLFAYGNHEIELVVGNPQYGQPGGQHSGFFPADQRFAGATRASTWPQFDVPGNLYWSTNFGPVHYIALNSYLTYGKSVAQTNWLNADLKAANANRAKVPWIVVVTHSPWYNSWFSHYMEGESMRTYYEPILRAAGVDLVVFGHVHGYERFDTLYNYRVDPCGPVYITAGNAGNREGSGKTSNPPNDYFNVFPQPPQSKFREYKWGHGVFETFNSSVAQWRYYRNDDAYPAVADSTYIYSHASGTYNVTYCAKQSSYPAGQHKSYILPWVDGKTNPWYPVQ